MLLKTPRASARPSAATPALFLFAVSGAAALGYQTVWSKMLAPGLGHEFPSVLAVVTSFMGGMALGSWFAHERIVRSPDPWRWYVGLETVIGVWACVLSWGLPWINRWVGTWIGLAPNPLRHWFVAFSIPLLILLPATAAMGATFPAMERVLSAACLGRASVGAVYGANTLGAAFGSVATIFFVAPHLGFHYTLWFMAALNFSCALIAAVFLRRHYPGIEPRTPRGPYPGPLSVWLLLSGMFGIGFEVVGVRVLSQVLEGTVYTFAAVLAVYLMGTAAGAACYQRFWGVSDFRGVLRVLLAALALSLSVSIWLLHWAKPLYETLRLAVPDSTWAVALAETTLALTIFALPTLFMGAVFSHLVQAWKNTWGGVGRPAALNTLGGALAALVFGVLSFPKLGASWTLILLVVGYACLMPRPRGLQWVLPAMALVVALFAPRPLRFVEVPPNGKLVRWEEGVMATVAVLEDAAGNRTLRINNRFQMGGTAAASSESRQALIPLLLHPAPRRALFLGVGTGISLGSATLHPGLQCDGVELLPEVADCLGAFNPANRGVENQPNTRIYVADARRFARECSSQYDVVVGDLFHPGRDGAGNLFAQEHYTAMRRILSPKGVICQWLPLHQMDTEVLRTVIRTFMEVFPGAQAWLLRSSLEAPVLGLISGGPEPASDWIEHRVRSGPLKEELRGLALGDSVRFFGCRLAGPKMLRSFAGDAPIHTDDHPYVTFGAPALTYRKSARAYESLLALLAQARADEIPAGVPPEFARRLTNYIQARDMYLGALVDETEGKVSKALDACVESARLSADFTSGYARVLTFASSFSQSRPQEAERLLLALSAARPENPVALQLLNKLFGK